MSGWRENAVFRRYVYIFNETGLLFRTSSVYISRRFQWLKQPYTNLVPRASFPLTSGRKTRALGATISGMRHRCRCAVSRITRIRLFPLFFHNGGSQSSRFPTAGQGERSSGNEIDLTREGPDPGYRRLRVGTNGILRMWLMIIHILWNVWISGAIMNYWFQLSSVRYIFDILLLFLFDMAR